MEGKQVNCLRVDRSGPPSCYASPATIGYWGLIEMNVRAPLLLVVGLLLGSSLVGCGAKYKEHRSVVSGKVTFEGRPIPEGTIRLKSLEKAPRSACMGVIKNGNYTIDVRGGVPVGEYSVSIEAIRQVPGVEPIPVEEMGTEYTPTEQYIPEKYNKRSELRIEITPESGQVNRDFELEP